MIPILLFILQSLSSILCLSCFDVRQSKGFGIFVKREPNGVRSYWIYDRNGTQWEFNLTENNGEMEVEKFGNKSYEDSTRVVNRFSNFFQFGQISLAYNCFIPIDSHRIECNVEVTTKVYKEEHSKTGVELNIENPLIFKTYPRFVKDFNGKQLMAYNKNNKSDKVRLEMFEIGSDSFKYNINIREDNLPNITFVSEMNDILFSQIDSMLDYNRDHRRGLSGHMLWFNIDRTSITIVSNPKNSHFQIRFSIK